MNRKINTLINVLIILLIIILITFMMGYYTDSLDIPTNNTSNHESEVIKNSQSGGANNKPIIDEIKNSGDIQNTEINNETPKNNPDENKNEMIDNNLSNEKTNEDGSNLLSPVIITSENDISSKEKKEILTELDKTLMELLEVVDKVQTIDESRLITDDSEVQE